MRYSARILLMACSACCIFFASAMTATASVTPLGNFAGSWTYIGPLAIEYDSDGAATGVWVGENSYTATRVKKYAPNGQSVLGSINIPAGGTLGPEGTVRDIHGLAVDPVTQELFVTDGSNQRVLKYSTAGVAIAQAPAPLVAGGCPSPCPVGSAANGSLNNPRGIEFGNGSLHVADSNNRRVQQLSSGFAYSDSLTNAWASAPAAKPIDVAIDSVTQHSFVALDSPDRVDEFDATGDFVKTYGNGDVLHGTASSVAVDSVSGLLYVAKSGHGRIDIYNTVTGDFVKTMTGFTNFIKDIAIDPVSRVLYASIYGEKNTARVERYGYSPAPACADDSVALLTGETIGIQLSCPDGDTAATVEYELVTQPANGTTSNFLSDAGKLDYTPDAGFSGADSFSFRAISANGVSETKTIAITVTPLPLPVVVKAAAVLPQPVWEQTTNIGYVSGTVRVKLPGSDSYTTLVGEDHVPLGTIVDATDGRCVVKLADKNNQIFSSNFWGGVFEVVQNEGDKLVGIIKLRDDQVVAAAASASAFNGLLGIAKKKKKKRNGVWGDGKGKFKTSGGGGSASVRGTRWYVANQSDGTYFKVASGKVLVRDFGLKKNIWLKAGQEYLAKYKKKKKSSKSRAK